MPDYALKAIDISKKFNDLVALDSVNLTVESGETIGLLGPNGAGKSTLINILCGVLKPDSGEIEFFGKRMKEPDIAFKLSLGVIPQEINLYQKMTARENLEFYGRLYGLDGKTLKNRIDETLKLVGLADRQNHRIETFSGGMKRRINICASILHSPKFIMMDEPTVGIDPQSRNLIFDVIERLHDYGITIIYTSHYMEEVERLCNNIVIIDRGKVIARGTKEELIDLIGGTDTIEIEPEKPDESGKDIFSRIFPDLKPSFVEGLLLLRTENATGKLSGIIETLGRNGIKIKRIIVREPNLENVFLHLTGKELRD